MLVIKRKRTRKLISLNLTKRPLKRGPLKARKSPQPVKAWFQKRKRKKSREALRKAEVLVVVAEVAGVVVKILLNKTRLLPLADHQK